MLVEPREPRDTAGATWVPSLDDVDAAAGRRRRRPVHDRDGPAHGRWAAATGTDAVVGTSGLTDADLAVAGAAANTGARILVVPNFSIGAVLAQRFAAQAAAHFESVEIVELHHDAKRDAPSGTSIATARSIAAARDAAGMGRAARPTRRSRRSRARAARCGPGGVQRPQRAAPGLLAHQEVRFGAPGEGLVIRHDTYDRASFMAGLVLAIRRIDRVEGVAVGLEAVLD